MEDAEEKRRRVCELSEAVAVLWRTTAPIEQRRLRAAEAAAAAEERDRRELTSALRAQLTAQTSALRSLLLSMRNAAAPKPPPPPQQLQQQQQKQLMQSSSFLADVGAAIGRRSGLPREECAAQQSRRLLARICASRLACVSTTHDFRGSIVDVRFDPSGARPLLVAVSTDGGSNEERNVGAAPTAGHNAVLYDFAAGRKFPLLEPAAPDAQERSPAHGGDTVSEVAFLPSGKHVVTGGYDGSFCVWDVSDLDAPEMLLHKIPCPRFQHSRPRQVQRFQLRPKSMGFLAAITSDDRRKNTVILGVDCITKTVSSLLRSSCECNELDWGGAGFEDTVVCAFDNGKADAFSISSASNAVSYPHRNFRKPDKEVLVSAVSCCRAQPLFVTGDSQGVMRIWDLRGKPKAPAGACPSGGSDVNCCSFSFCERFIQGAMEHNNCWVFDVRKLALPLHVLQHGIPKNLAGPQHSIFKQGVNMARWSPSGLLATCGEDSMLCLWDVIRGGSSPLLAKLASHPDGVTCASFSADETLVASGCDGHRLALHALTDEAAAQEQHHRLQSNAVGDPWTGTFLPLQLPLGCSYSAASGAAAEAGAVPMEF